MPWSPGEVVPGGEESSAVARHRRAGPWYGVNRRALCGAAIVRTACVQISGYFVRACVRAGCGAVGGGRRQTGLDRCDAMRCGARGMDAEWRKWMRYVRGAAETGGVRVRRFRPRALIFFGRFRLIHVPGVSIACRFDRGQRGWSVTWTGMDVWSWPSQKGKRFLSGIKKRLIRSEK